MRCSKTIIAIAVGYEQELDGEALLQRMLISLFAGHEKIKLELN